MIPPRPPITLFPHSKCLNPCDKKFPLQKSLACVGKNQAHLKNTHIEKPLSNSFSLAKRHISKERWERDGKEWSWRASQFTNTHTYACEEKIPRRLRSAESDDDVSPGTVRTARRQRRTTTDGAAGSSPHAPLRDAKNRNPERIQTTR